MKNQYKTNEKPMISLKNLAKTIVKPIKTKKKKQKTIENNKKNNISDI